MPPASVGWECLIQREEACPKSCVFRGREEGAGGQEELNKNRLWWKDRNGLWSWPCIGGGRNREKWCLTHYSIALKDTMTRATPIKWSIFLGACLASWSSRWEADCNGPGELYVLILRSQAAGRGGRGVQTDRLTGPGERFWNLNAHPSETS